MNYVIGMDVGGTNTDAVLVNASQQIVAKHKTFTTTNPAEGILQAMQQLLDSSQCDKSAVKGLFIGTTHATNAILDCQNLFRVGVIRLAGYRPSSLGCCAFWPKELYQAVFVDCITIDGGFTCDGKGISPFDKLQAKNAARQLIEKGAEAIAIVGVFSPLFCNQEQECAEAVYEVAGTDFPLSMSHQIGGIGFIERENAAILNCALKKSIRLCFDNLEKIRVQCGVDAPIWITQNDGSMIDIKQAIELPLLTISSGPTNSFIGASKLTEANDAIIVDIGGTSTDIGMIKNGYPKRSIHNVNIGGVNLNFRVPDVLALAIGGGSYVDIGDDKINVGPKSCGKQLLQEAQVFGGNHLTVTDVAVAAGMLKIPQAMSVSLKKADAEKVMSHIIEKIEYGIQRMRGGKKAMPVVVVGGGAPFMTTENAVFPKNYDVANAYGSALAEISGSVDTVVSLVDREATLQKLKEDALQEAVNKGADSKDVRIVDVAIFPYHYMPGHLAKVSIKASGKKL
jgi:N-methylhydantoinase A/oxoprolinase/acetone carboxylase beta subunit